MSKKKIFWIVLFVIVVCVIIAGLIIVRPKDNSTTASTNIVNFNKTAETTSNEENKKQNNELKEYQKVELSDGILYSLDGKEQEAEIVLGDNYFDTTISDMYMNPEDYYKTNIQIEGMYLTDGVYTSVGRYSTSSLCQFCPAGYSFIEYQLDGKLDREFTAEKDWIKIIGTLEKANDETSHYQDYYYIKVKTLEVMNEKGNDTVNN